jgi:hypothetical protein
MGKSKLGWLELDCEMRSELGTQKPSLENEATGM